MFSSVRTAIVLIVLSSVSISSVFAQERKIAGTVEYNQTVRSDGNAHQLNALTQFNWEGKKLGVSTFALVTSGFGEFYVGPSYAVTDWLSISGSLGIESGRPSLRKAGSVWLGNGRVSFLSIQEKGSNRWQRNIAKATIGKGITVGFLQQTYVGAGPYVEFARGKAVVYGSYAPADHRGIVALKVGL